MVRIFCDFDGTLATEDIGKEIFLKFAGSDAAVLGAQYVNGEITARECLLREAAAVVDVQPDQLLEFIDQFRADPTFGAFRAFCDVHNVPIVVLSDGLDFYVERLLRRTGFGDVVFFANHLSLKREGLATKMRVTFPYTDSECEFCGNCKRNHMLTGSGDDDIIVYIGDGISDRCPVRYADVVFAKKSLIKYCQKENISYHEFSNFTDVQRRLESLLLKKRIRPRREAAMARRNVFMQG
jgi:2-hydroxy-3-keto-5-methylthiopentenyl-1-phosphate phosphatase